MAYNVTQAEKTKKGLEDYEERIAKAIAEWEATRKQTPLSDLVPTWGIEGRNEWEDGEWDGMGL